MRLLLHFPLHPATQGVVEVELHLEETRTDLPDVPQEPARRPLHGEERTRRHGNRKAGHESRPARQGTGNGRARWIGDRSVDGESGWRQRAEEEEGTQHPRGPREEPEPLA
jgi:hypothetical protein